MTHTALNGRTLLRWLTRLVTFGLLAWVAWKLDWKALGGLLSSSQGLLVLAAALGCMLIGQVCATLRWLILLRLENPAFSFARAFRLTLIGAFASLFLPTTAGGDVIRILSLDDRQPAAGVSVVAMDRLLSVLGMAFLLPFSLIIMLPHLGVPKTGLAAACIVLLAAPEPTGMRRFLAPVVSFLKNLKDNLLTWRGHPWRLLAAFFLALSSNASGWACVWILAAGLKISVSYWQIAGAGVWIYFAGLLPIAINGLGIQEAGYVYLYGLLGVVPALAATLGLLTRLVYVLAVLPGGIWLAFSPEIKKIPSG